MQDEAAAAAAAMRELNSAAAAIHLPVAAGGSTHRDSNVSASSSEEAFNLTPLRRAEGGNMEPIVSSASASSVSTAASPTGAASTPRAPPGHSQLPDGRPRADSAVSSRQSALLSSLVAAGGGTSATGRGGSSSFSERYRAAMQPDVPPEGSTMHTQASAPLGAAGPMSPTSLFLQRTQREDTVVGGSPLMQMYQGTPLPFFASEGTVEGLGRDLSRTFPQLAFFAAAHSDERQQLANVLSAFAFARPDIGYTQGMTYIVAVLVLILRPPGGAFSAFQNTKRARRKQRATHAVVELRQDKREATPQRGARSSKEAKQEETRTVEITPLGPDGVQKRSEADCSPAPLLRGFSASSRLEVAADTPSPPGTPSTPDTYEPPHSSAHVVHMQPMLGLIGPKGAIGAAAVTASAPLASPPPRRTPSHALRYGTRTSATLKQKRPLIQHHIAPKPRALTEGSLQQHTLLHGGEWRGSAVQGFSEYGTPIGALDTQEGSKSGMHTVPSSSDLMSVAMSEGVEEGESDVEGGVLKHNPPSTSHSPVPWGGALAGFGESSLAASLGVMESGGGAPAGAWAGSGTPLHLPLQQASPPSRGASASSAGRSHRSLGIQRAPHLSAGFAPRRAPPPTGPSQPHRPPGAHAAHHSAHDLTAFAQSAMQQHIRGGSGILVSPLRTSSSGSPRAEGEADAAAGGSLKPSASNSSLQSLRGGHAYMMATQTSQRGKSSGSSGECSPVSQLAPPVEKPAKSPLRPSNASSALSDTSSAFAAASGEEWTMESRVFRCFMSLATAAPMRRFFNLDRPFMEAWFEVFETALQRNSPKAASVLHDIDLPPDAFLLKWFMTFFAQPLAGHLEVVLVIWDRTLCLGAQEIMKAAVALAALTAPLLQHLSSVNQQAVLARLPDDLKVFELRFFERMKAVNLTDSEIARLLDEGAEVEPLM